jgi:hypothetical protein
MEEQETASPLSNHGDFRALPPQATARELGIRDSGQPLRFQGVSLDNGHSL